MADADPSEAPPSTEEPAPSTPLDHPLFLPVLFAGCAIWFGYDGYWNQDPKMLEHQEFNRFGFQLLVFLGALWGYRGICEMKKMEGDHLWLLPLLLVGMTGWTASSLWLSDDPFDLEHAAVLRSVLPFLAFATLLYAGLALRGRAWPFAFAVVIGAPALRFAYAGLADGTDRADGLAWLGAATVLGGIALWSAVSTLRRGSR